MTNWRIEVPEDIPRQTNSFDCGVFTCLFATYSSQQKTFDFNQDDMPNYRAEIECEIRKENEKIQKENYHSTLYNIVRKVVLNEKIEKEEKEKLEAKNSASSVLVPPHSHISKKDFTDVLIENLTLKASSKKRKFNSSDAYGPKKSKTVGSNNTYAASANPTTGGDIQPNIMEASCVSPNSAPLDNKLTKLTARTSTDLLKEMITKKLDK